MADDFPSGNITFFPENLDFYISNRVAFRFTITHANEACIL
jgi:hypothetical protein